MCWNCGAKRHFAAMCPKSQSMALNALDEADENILMEVHENEDWLHAWCTLEDSESEQWQEVISKQERKTLKKEVRISLLER